MTKNIGTEFMRMTVHARLSPSGEKTGIPQPTLEMPVPKSAKKICVPAPKLPENTELDLVTALEMRRSLRSYNDHPLTLINVITKW